MIVDRAVLSLKDAGVPFLFDRVKKLPKAAFAGPLRIRDGLAEGVYWVRERPRRSRALNGDGRRLAQGPQKQTWLLSARMGLATETFGSG